MERSVDAAEGQYPGTTPCEEEEGGEWLLFIGGDRGENEEDSESSVDIGREEPLLMGADMEDGNMMRDNFFKSIIIENYLQKKKLKI